MANTRLQGGAETFTGDRDRAAEARRAGIEAGQRMPYSRAERGPASARGGWSGAPAAPSGGTSRAPGRLPGAGGEETQERRR